MDVAKYRALFVEEARQFLTQIGKRVVALEHATSTRTKDSDEVLRAVHSVKGMAASMGYDPIVNLAHHIEDAVVTRREAGFNSNHIDLLLRSIDALSLQVESIADERSVKNEVKLLKELRALAQKRKIRTRSRAKKKNIPSEEPIPPVLMPGLEPVVRVKTAVLDELMDALGELHIERDKLRNALSSEVSLEIRAGFTALGRRIRYLQEKVLGARMIPVRTLTDRYPRVVRDLSQQLGKEVRWEIEGEEIRVDRSVVDRLDELIVHLLRNAIDHGIEPPAQRRAAGKTNPACVRFEAKRERGGVRVTVQDDGRGLNPPVLKALALQKGLLDPARANAMTPRDCLFLICQPGFSTRENVTDISGRGMGMDVVRSEIETMGGQLDLESKPGVGTKVSLYFPFSLAVAPILIVRWGDQAIGLPARRVIAVRDASSPGVLDPRSPAVSVSLGEWLRLESHPVRHHVWLEAGADEPCVLGVESVVGYHDVVHRALGSPLAELGWFSSAAVLGDGSTLLVLDISKLFRASCAA